jgi:hypothetical protein
MNLRPAICIKTIDLKWLIDDGVRVLKPEDGATHCTNRSCANYLHFVVEGLLRHVSRFYLETISSHDGTCSLSIDGGVDVFDTPR